DAVSVQEVPGDPTYEQIAAAGVERQFRRNARIGATENAGERVLAPGQRVALVPEVVPLGNAVDIALVALHQALQRRLRRQDVRRLGGSFGRCGESIARDRQPRHRGPGEREEVTPRYAYHMTCIRIGT